MRAVLIARSRWSHPTDLLSTQFITLFALITLIKETRTLRITQLLKTKLAGLLIVAISASLLVPALAGAQQVDPTTSQYSDRLTQVSAGGSPPPSTDTGLGGNVGPLPFTGFDVIAMAAVALAVTGLGLGLQRAVSREPNDGLS
jgi:hypothetical protein